MSRVLRAGLKGAWTLLLTLLAAACLTGAGALALSAGEEVVYTVRLAGTPGLFAVESCEEGVPDNPAARCEGSFRSDDGRVESRPASIDLKADPGSRVPVQCEEGACHRVGLGATLWALTLPTLALLGAGGAGWLLVAAFRDSGRLQLIGATVGLLGTLVGIVGPVAFGGLAALALHLGW
ncbi:hypothetical protein ACWGB8_19280 [Kitasatospora sp. NPDC054939]